MDGKLTEAFTVAELDPGKYYDGRHGLFLRVMPSGSRQWVQRIAVQGRTREFGLGGCPLVTLRQARAMAIANRRIARKGGDPAAGPEWTHPAAIPAAQAAVPTFAEAAEEVIALRAPEWRSARTQDNWRGIFERYAYSRIGGKTVDRITTADLTAVLRPVWSSKRATALRLKRRLGTVMRWAQAHGMRPDNPADSLSAVLPKTRLRAAGSHRALPHWEVPGAVRAVIRSGAWDSTKRAFVFLVLTAARSGEVRMAEARELDPAEAVWTVPGGRMKAGRRHRVPLSSGARHVLETSPAASDSGLLFPAPRGGVMSDNTLSKMLRDLGVKAVPHGFRSSFRDWAAEEAEAPRELAELALAHMPYGAAEAAYARSDLLEKRRDLMQAWCDYLDLSRPDIAGG